MEELVPVLIGVLVAVAAMGLPGRRFGAWPWVAAAALGATWSIAIGEAAHSWLFALADATQSVAALLLLRWLARRSSWGRRPKRR